MPEHHTQDGRPYPSLVVACFANGDPASYLPTVASILHGIPDTAEVVVGSPDPERHLELGRLARVSLTLAQTAVTLVNRMVQERGAPVLAVTEQVILPTGFVDRALALVQAELRAASVSFLSHRAGYLSFPYLGVETGHQVDDFDEERITRRLRSLAPEPLLVPIPYATGAVVLFSDTAVDALGGLDEGPELRLEFAAADLSLRGRKRGFLDFLDAGTYYSRPSDLSGVERSSYLTGVEFDELARRHTYAPTVLDRGYEADRSTTHRALTAARVKVKGLRVLIDAAAVGPKEMGTQVQTLALIEALCARDDVASVAVGLPGPIPSYGARVLALPKVDARTCPPNDFTGFGPVDVAHRPFQPDLGFDPVGWARTAERSLITLQDLIAYQIPAYHPTAEAWDQVRMLTRRAVGLADGVVTVSHDTANMVRRECLPVDDQRVFVAENGTDHLTGSEAGVPPRELLERGFGAEEFILVLGANYAHKNRDLALRTAAELHRRGRHPTLVCVGAHVPFGSLRAEESRVMLDEREFLWPGTNLFVIPDVASEERNWLLRHAGLVLYPTGAEGFGLVPYEAARFGTPTVLVSFGPLAEVAPELPVPARAWTPAALATACETLLSDPEARAAQIAAVLHGGTDYTWAATAEKLVTAYRTVLSAAPRRV